MHYLYILHSKSSDKYYIGETFDADIRLEKHNTHFYSNSFTKIAEDWTMVLQYQGETKESILFLERFIKKMKSKKFIAKVIQNPDILTDILLKRKN